MVQSRGGGELGRALGPCGAGSSGSLRGPCWQAERGGELGPGKELGLPSVGPTRRGDSGLGPVAKFWAGLV